MTLDQVDKEYLFNKYQLSFDTLSSYIAATYDPEIMRTLGFDAVRDSLSDGQTASKLWVVDQLCMFLGIQNKSVCVLGGWVGLLCKFIADYGKVASITNVELDGSLETINRRIMGGSKSKFDFCFADMYEFDYDQKQFDIYINTSGEHIPSLKEWIEKIPEGKIVIIQSNDFFSHPQHINCVDSIQELIEKVEQADNVKNIIYRGTMKLPIYNRFMVMLTT